MSAGATEETENKPHSAFSTCKMAQIWKERQPPLVQVSEPPPNVYGEEVTAPCTTPEPVKFSYSIDLASLERDLDRRIMADKNKGQVMSPRDLYVRSNPGLLGRPQDLTNPREWYSSSAAKSLMKTLANQDTRLSYDADEKPGSVPVQSTVAFLVNFPTLSSSSSAIGFNREATQIEPPKVDRRPSEKRRSKARNPFPQIKHSDNRTSNNDTELRKQTLDYDDHKPKDKENDPMANKSFVDDDHLPPIDDESEFPDFILGGKGNKENTISLPKLTKKDITMPQQNVLRKPREEEKIQQWFHTTLPEETLRHAQIKAGLARDYKNERKVLSTNNSRDPETFQTYTEKYMQLRIPRAHRNERKAHENLHKTYHMRQKSILKLKMTYNEDEKVKKLHKQRMGYDRNVPDEFDYKSVKSKLSDYIKSGMSDKDSSKTPSPTGTQHSRREQERFLGPASHVTYKRPQFSLGPNAKPITPMDKYHAETFPLVMDSAIPQTKYQEVQHEDSDNRHSQQSSSNRKYVSNSYIGKVRVKKGKTKASVVNISLSNAPSTVDYGENEDASVVYDTRDTYSINDGSTLWQSDLNSSVPYLGPYAGDKGSYKAQPAPALSLPPGFTRQSTTLAKFKKLEVFGERQADQQKQSKKKTGHFGEEIESLRGSQNLYPPYVLDTGADKEGEVTESEFSSHLPDNPKRRVSTVTLGTDMSDTATQRPVDNFPKSRGAPSLASRQKSNAMAPLMEKSFVSDHTKLGVVSTAKGTRGSDADILQSSNASNKVHAPSTNTELRIHTTEDLTKPVSTTKEREDNLHDNTQAKSDFQVIIPTDDHGGRTTGSTVPTNSVSPNMETGLEKRSANDINSKQSLDVDIKSPYLDERSRISPVPSEACRL